MAIKITLHSLMSGLIDLGVPQRWACRRTGPNSSIFLRKDVGATASFRLTTCTSRSSSPIARGLSSSWYQHTVTPPASSFSIKVFAASRRAGRTWRSDGPYLRRASLADFRRTRKGISHGRSRWSSKMAWSISTISSSAFTVSAIKRPRETLFLLSLCNRY